MSTSSAPIKVDVNQILLERIQQLEEENILLKEEIAKLKGEKLAYGRIHRNPAIKPTGSLYSTYFDGAHTLPEVWRRVVDKYKNEKAMGFRVLTS